MKLYLVRHGEAVSALDDTARPLSEHGTIEVKKMANFLAKNKVNVAAIYHSEKLRAVQTAQLIAEALGYLIAKRIHGLLPDDSVKDMSHLCNHFEEDLMLVGHLPFMGKLVSELMLEREDQLCVEFQTAAIICLERLMPTQWCITWLLHPSLL